MSSEQLIGTFSFFLIFQNKIFIFLKTIPNHTSVEPLSQDTNPQISVHQTLAPTISIMYFQGPISPDVQIVLPVLYSGSNGRGDHRRYDRQPHHG